MTAACKGARVPRNPTPDEALARALKRLRAEREMTQEAVAYRAGIAVGSLAKIETARTVPSWDTVRRIAQALDTSLVELAKAVEAEG
jgi:transcriptional regulator with XRE-family HTH domain